MIPDSFQTDQSDEKQTQTSYECDVKFRIRHGSLIWVPDGQALDRIKKFVKMPVLGIFEEGFGQIEERVAYMKSCQNAPSFEPFEAQNSH